MWTWTNADINAISNRIGMIRWGPVLPSVASFVLCFIFIFSFFFWHASQKTLGLCHTLRLTMPHYRPWGMRVIWCSRWGIPGQADWAWKPWVITVIQNCWRCLLRQKPIWACQQRSPMSISSHSVGSCLKTLSSSKIEWCHQSQCIAHFVLALCFYVLFFYRLQYPTWVYWFHCLVVLGFFSTSTHAFWN